MNSIRMVTVYLTDYLGGWFQGDQQVSHNSLERCHTAWSLTGPWKFETATLTTKL